MAHSIWARDYYVHGESKSMTMMKEAGVQFHRLPEEDVEAIYDEMLRWLTEDYAYC